MLDNITFEELKEKVSKYITNEDELKLIDKAFHYTYNFHNGKKRLTGDDYIVHPLNIAMILTSIQTDTNTICAGLLHDVLEGNYELKEDLISNFNVDIANLVEGVTKINRLNFNGDNKAVIESHRKVLVGLSEDVRVIIIKLADRLHNMRTLYILPEDIQREKAKETLDVLVPIASRLGMNNFKSELEDLSLRYLKPDVYFSIIEKLNSTKNERDDIVNKMINEVSLILDKNNLKYKIKGRSKSIYSIYKKLCTGRTYDDIYDISALRVYVNEKNECYQALGLIHSVFKPIPKRFKDYIAMPKTNLYQSLHTTVFGVMGHVVEIQIRTYEMDRIAENGIASHWSYKEHGSTKADVQNTMEQKLQFFKSVMEISRGNSTDEEFIKNIQDEVLKENIYVFTPKGDVIELPNGSNPIDFAYRVHSNVGDKMVGAIVNEAIVPLDYVLQTNDIVKINVNKNSIGPSREWINMAFTSQARNKIKAFFNKIEKEDFVKIGEELLIKELRKRKIVQSEFLNNTNIEIILKEYSLKNIDELYISIGSNKLTVGSIINLIYNSSPTREDLILSKIKNKKIDNNYTGEDIIVSGIDNIKITIAGCCKPIPQDKIIGYISKGSGIIIHRSNCPNMSNVNERLIDVSWEEVTAKKYNSTIIIESTSNKNILLEIIAKTSNTDINVLSINTVNSNEKNTYELTVSVHNLEKLNKFINEISSIDDILEVRRIIK